MTCDLEVYCLDVFRILGFFFFKQKTAYELRNSDWSSGVCSSDLGLTLILVTTETRFNLAFAALMGHCMGTANRRRIEKARRKVGRTIRLDLRDRKRVV